MNARKRLGLSIAVAFVAVPFLVAPVGAVAGGCPERPALALAVLPSVDDKIFRSPCLRPRRWSLDSARAIRKPHVLPARSGGGSSLRHGFGGLIGLIGRLCAQTGSDRATATGKFGTATVTSNQAQATVNQVKATGTMDATGTTCQQIRGGTATRLLQINYSIKGQNISALDPGVFFYDSKITAPSSSFTIAVLQSNTLNWAGMELNNLQFILWDSNCNKVQTVTLGGTSTAPTLSVTGVTAGATYYIQVKFDPDTLKGQLVPSSKPTVTYLFQTSLTVGTTTTLIPSSGATINVVYKK